MSSAMIYPCSGCGSAVRARQEALLCDRCDWWRHRKCGTSINRDTYRKLMRQTRDGVTFTWCCPECSVDPADHSDHSIPKLDHSEMTDDLIAMEGRHSEADVNIPAKEVCVIHEDYPDSAPLPVQLPPDRPIEYQVIATGTKRGKPKLHDTEGFTYTVKKNTTTSTYWWCSIRQKENLCPATVIQKGQTFKRGMYAHTHAGNPGALLQTKVRVKVLQEALTQKQKPAKLLAKDIISEMMQEGDHCLPKPVNETRAVNRKRQALRHPEPILQELKVNTNSED